MDEMAIPNSVGNELIPVLKLDNDGKMITVSRPVIVAGTLYFGSTITGNT